MRILFDARSVKTPAGVEVYRGLVKGWSADDRVSDVITLYTDLGTELLVRDLGGSGVQCDKLDWPRHLAVTIPRMEKALGADVTFLPNGMAAPTPRCVVYFQDILHFRRLKTASLARYLARGAWRMAMLERAGLAVSVSEDIGKEVRRTSSLPHVVIPNGVDVNGVTWTGASDRIFVMGGAGARKSEETAILAWRDVGQYLPRTELVIGGVSPESRRNHLMALVSEFGLERVVIHGSIDRQAYLNFIATSRMSVSCTTLESYGMPLAEALCIGAPVVCSDIPAHRELVDQANAGLLFRSGSADSLAKKLSDVLITGATIPRQLNRAPLGWNWTARARQHIDFYQSELR